MRISVTSPLFRIAREKEIKEINTDTQFIDTSDNYVTVSVKRGSGSVGAELTRNIKM